VGNNTAVCCEGTVGQTKVAPRSATGSPFVYRRGKCVAGMWGELVSRSWHYDNDS